MINTVSIGSMVKNMKELVNNSKVKPMILVVDLVVKVLEIMMDSLISSVQCLVVKVEANLTATKDKMLPQV